MAREAEGRVEIPVATPGGTGRNPEGIGCGASDIAATRGILNQERRDLMEAVVERENTWTHVTVWSRAYVSKQYMNRRIRNRTSGGVGGRRG